MHSNGVLLQKSKEEPPFKLVIIGGGHSIVIVSDVYEEKLISPKLELTRDKQDF